MGPYFLTSARLGFRTWRPDDLPLAVAIWGDIEVTRLNGGPFAPAYPAARLASEISNLAEHGYQYWPIFWRETGAHAGCCGLQPRDAGARIFELGYYLRPPFWRRGLAAEAARAVVGYAFGQLGAQALFAGHHADNASSRRILQDLGFRYTHHEFYAPSGVDEPCYLLRPDDVSNALRPGAGR